MPVIMYDTLGRQSPSTSDYKLVGGSDVAIRSAFDLSPSGTNITLADDDTLLLDNTDVVDLGSNNTDGTKESTGKIQLSQMATYIAGASNFTINNGKLLTALSSLESSGDAADEDIVIGADAGDTIVITGNLKVSGTTTTVNTATLAVEDKNIELGKVGSPSDTTADGGGITLKGAGDKTFNWVNATDAWTSSEHIQLATSKNFLIDGGKIGYTDGSISNAEGFAFTIPTGKHAYLELIKDAGDTNNDFWAIHNDGNLKLESKISGNYQSFFTITPNATPADSQITIPGKIISNDGATGSFILSGPGTDNHVTLEMYGDANIEKWKMLDTHTSGLFALQNYGNGAWQTMMSITPNITPLDSKVNIAGDLEAAGQLKGNDLVSGGTISINPGTPAADTKILWGDNNGITTSTAWCTSFDDSSLEKPFLFDYGTKTVGAATKFKITKDGNVTATGTITGTSLTADSVFLKDIGGDHTVKIRIFEDNTGDKELRFKLNDAIRTIDISGDVTAGGTVSISNNFTTSGGNRTLDQDVSSGASPLFSMVNMVDLPTSALANDMVTYPKMQNISTNSRLLGRNDAADATVSEVQVQTDMIASNAVTLAKMETVDSMTLLGRVSGGAGNLEELNSAHVKLMLSGIADNNFLTVDTPHTTISAGQYARFTSAGLEGRGAAGVRSDLGISDNEIIDWTVDQGGTNIHPNNVDIDLSGAGVDWTADQGTTNIHVNNLTGSPYFDQLFLTDEIDMSFVGSSGQLKDVMTVHDEGGDSTTIKWIHSLSHNKGPYFTAGVVSSTVDYADKTVTGSLLGCYDTTGITGSPGIVNIMEASWPENSSIQNDLIVDHIHLSRFTSSIVMKDEHNLTISSGTAAVQLAAGDTGNCLKLTLTENLTSGLFFTNNPPGPCTITLRIIQDGTGGRTISNWPTACKWPGGTAPLLSTGANDIDILSFYFDGTNYYGTIVRDFS